ncbi:MAG: ATP-binding protein [Acidobacteriales bacterium]|nr:ATP-binding protein [Terriglobales bacterium]
MTNQQLTPGKRPRKSFLVSLAIAIGLLFVLLLIQVSFRPPEILNPDNPQGTFILLALSALIFLLFIALSFVLLRNLLKLYAERRVGVLGSKFRSRMVVGALLLSLAPVICLFLFAYGLMNRSIDRWFSRPVEELREESGRVAALLGRYAVENAHAEAEAIAALPETVHAFETGNYASVINEFRRRERTLQGGFAVAVLDDYAMAALHVPEPWGQLRAKLPPSAYGEQQGPGTLTVNNQEYVVGSGRVGSTGRIVIAMPLPANFREAINRIEASEHKYYELSQQRKRVRRFYMGFLLFLTMLVLFASTWFALLLSKMVTRPVAALAEATQEISRGNLTYRIDVPATDELGDLVTSFNRMAEELEASRREIEASSRRVADANVELEQRRRHMETILESIPTGVLSLDANHLMTRVNDALVRLLSPAASLSPGALRNFPVGTSLSQLFSSEVVDELLLMMRKSDRMGAVTSQMEIPVQRATLNVAVTVASLTHGPQRLGYVLVFEDLSDVLKAQKQAAWREVARRIAHEIKNPLTPIALSAERIRRHLERGTNPDAASLKVIQGCSETIEDAVATVRTLVDEFSVLARFPASQPQPADINAIVQSALALFNGRLDGVRLQTLLSPELPAVMADPSAMKRAIANLVDNAAEAMQESLVKEVAISTSLLATRDGVEIVVADTGPGIDQELKEKLFLPYFSTKKRGTGLGLAIVGRIIEEHHGSIRVEENSPVGARFVVELPLANGAANGTAPNG